MPSINADAKLPIDTTVPVPPALAKQIADAAALHERHYPKTPAPPPELPAAPAVTPPAVEPPAAPIPAVAPPPAPAAPPAPPVDEGNWEHRYHSMKGRYDQTQQTVGQLQQQMSELGDELGQCHQVIQQLRAGPAQTRQALRPQGVGATDEDVKTYGPELIDVVARVARGAVAPDLQQVSQQTRQTNQRVMQSAQGALYADMDREVPTWKEINVNPRFKTWCRLPDVYSGVVRGQLLKDAFQAANAPRVMSFFKGFLAEEVATGQVPAPGAQPTAVVPPPRTAAVPLENLTAPGRAKPAGGDQPTNAADKPVFSRAQVADFYAKVRRGEYAGNPTLKAQHEAMIFAAQAAGRIT